METDSLIQKPIDRENERNLAKYRNIVYYSTFVAYAMSHFSRKCYTNVKVELKGIGFDPILLSQMDTGFMFFYAIGSLCSGQLGDRLHAPTVVGLGLLGSAACVLALTIGIWEDVEGDSVWFYHFFFLTVWLVHGLMQSTGGPVNTAIMGNWFGAKNRGSYNFTIIICIGRFWICIHLIHLILFIRLDIRYVDLSSIHRQYLGRGSSDCYSSLKLVLDMGSDYSILLQCIVGFIRDEFCS